MHDVLDLRDIVADEVEQMATSGHDVGTAAQEVRQAAESRDFERLREIQAALAKLERHPSWPFDEPTDEPRIVDIARSVEAVAVDASGLPDRIQGAWLGRAVGNTLGKPIEGLTRQEATAYLRSSGRWPLSDYLPLMDPLPEGVSRLHPSAPLACAGCFVDVPRDDDIDWTILNLHLLERHGRGLTTDHVAAGWLDRMPFTQTYTAERAAYRNLIGGLRPPATAVVANPYREWIGALIRGDVFGMVSPGDPGEAARLALVDARLSHVANGLYGEIWAAALVAAALASATAEAAMAHAVRVVPHASRLAAVLRDVMALHEQGIDRVAALDWVDRELGAYSWVHTLNNAALIAIALLWGHSFLDAAGLAMAGGRDTDSTTATVGCVYGALHGTSAIPDHLILARPVHVRSSVRDFDRITIEELAERTSRLVRTP